MHAIVDHLYLGDANDSQNYYLLRRNKIKLIVNCAGELPNAFTHEFRYIHLNLDDDASNRAKMRSELRRTRALQAIEHAVASGNNVLVHCAAGISRSASVVALWLHEVRGVPIANAVRFIQHKRPVAFKFGFNFL